MSFDLSVAVDRPRVAVTRKKWYVGCRAWSQLSENIYLSGVSMKSRESVSGGMSNPPPHYGSLDNRIQIQRLAR